ncbi:fructose-6-phosphate aldolase [Candidatus Omnitrophota bacterium]
MKLFLDSADVDTIRKAFATGLLDGVTTNPTFISRTGRKFADVVKEICSIVSGSVSVEVMADDASGMVDEAVKISSIAPNIAVKIPMTVEGLKAVPIIEQEKNIRTNVTMVFSPTQAFLAMKAGATYVSLVLSRLDAIAHESDILIEDTVTIKHTYGFDSDILAASLKTQNHMLSALRSGVDIATIPDALFFQMFNHPLTDTGLAAFKHDWEKVQQ